LIKEDIRDASGPNGGLTVNRDGFAVLWATSDNEVEISLKENECQVLRRLTIPIFEFADKRNKTERRLLCPLPFLEPPVSEKIN
jgi:hypothetical protein